MTSVVAIPGMVLLWLLWQRGFVVQSVRAARAGADKED